jgi:hypothetical protein
MTVMTGRLDRPLLDQATDWLRNLLPPGILGKYILVNGLVGIAMLAYAVVNAPLSLLYTLVALFIMGFCTEWAPVKLTWTPLQGSNLSMSAGVAFAALLILGPAGAILVNSGSALAYCLKEKRPFYKRLMTTAALATSSGVSGMVYILAGGQVPLVLVGQSLIAAGLAAWTFFLFNSSLISGAVSLASGRPFRSVLSNWQWLFLGRFPNP